MDNLNENAAKFNETNTIAGELQLRISQVDSTVKLLDDGNTVPFIARYRKEATGELDENQIRAIEERLKYLRNLKARKEEVLRIIEDQGKLTDELRRTILKAVKMQEVEDLYRPYKQKRRTRATIAKERGLEPLALRILAQDDCSGDPETIAAEFVNPEKEVNTPAEAIAGAMDIIAEIISDDATIRGIMRQNTFKDGIIFTRGLDKEKSSPFEMYYDYKEAVAKVPPHRILAINRGEKEEFLNVTLEVNIDHLINLIIARVVTNSASIWSAMIRETAADAYKRLIAPSVEREIRNELTDKGEEQAILIFSGNLRNLLLQAPVRGKTVLGLDPGFRTGCKTAVVDDTGKVLQVGVIYPHPPQNKVEEAKQILLKLVRENSVELITIGNGTASRETEALVASFIKENNLSVSYSIVSEAGASVYSASKIAGEEFPDFDLSLRSAVSIARRLQDPLAELVKIEPKAVGVGQYQHDVTPKKLDESLHGVVESCVNSVGVDLNTASASLLKYVAGIKPTVAKSIVDFREKNGKFGKRRQLLKVPKLGEQTFIQCAGFIMLPEGVNPLENTPVHPESYAIAEQILTMLGENLESIRDQNKDSLKSKLSSLDVTVTAQKLGAGVPTVKDIIEALQKPGRDPRDEMPKPIFRTDVTTLESLSPGMVLDGVVRNVVDFGAFVDIGIKHDGLVHISQLSAKFVKHPMELVSVGDNVKVKVLAIDMARERVSLSMRDL